MIRPGNDKKRWAGMSSPSTFTVHDPVARRPVTYQSSKNVTAEVGTMKSPSSTTVSPSTTTAPSSSQSARSEPDANGHTPSSRNPSAVFTGATAGPITADTTASGSSP